MSLIDQRVAAARRRLWINRYLQYLGTCLLWAGLAWLVAVLVKKILVHDLRMDYLALGLAGAAGLAALVWLILTAEDQITAAVALDQAGAIKERLSTALYLRASADPFSQAAVADAERTAAMLQVRNVLPVRYPRRASHAAAGWAAALVVLWLVPMYYSPAKVQANQKKQEELKKQQEIVARKVEQIQKAKEQIQKTGKGDVELTKKLEELEQRLAGLGKQPDNSKMGVEAVKQVSNLKEEVLKQQQSLQKETDAMQGALAKLALADMDSKTQISEFSKVLASGDFKQSKAALQQLQKQIQEASKDPAKAAELAKQLDALAKALKDQSMSAELSKELKAAGLSKEQMDKLAQALKDGKSLSEAQKQELQKAMKDQGLSDQQVGEMMKKLSNAMKASQMANKLGQSMADASANLKQKGQGNKNSGQQGQAGNRDQESQQTEASPGGGEGQQGKSDLADAGEQLGEMEAMQTELQSMQAMLADLQGQPSQAAGQAGEGEARQGAGKNPNGGFGNGLGEGGVGGLRPTTHTPTALTKSKADTKWRNGRIVGEYFEEGQQVKGQSRQELVDVIASAERDAAKTIDEHKLPPQYDGPVGEYFRQLRQLGQAGGSPAGGSAPAGQ